MHLPPEATDFLASKSGITHQLFEHLLESFASFGEINLHKAKTMIGICNADKCFAWVTQAGKNFVHVVFPFEQAYPDNLCFTKIAQVPGDEKQFNHHFRMYSKEDINDEVMSFMKLAYSVESKQ